MKIDLQNWEDIKRLYSGTLTNEGDDWRTQIVQAQRYSKLVVPFVQFVGNSLNTGPVRIQSNHPW